MGIYSNDNTFILVVHNILILALDMIKAKKFSLIAIPSFD
jgi:hypothetical protein